MQPRLLRSYYDRKLAGVCGGLGAYFEIDSTLVRLVMILLIFTGLSFFIYPVLWLIMPSEKPGAMPPPFMPHQQAGVVPPPQQPINAARPAYRYDPFTGQPIAEQPEAYTGTTVQVRPDQYMPPFMQGQQPAPVPTPAPRSTRNNKKVLGLLLLAFGLITMLDKFSGAAEFITPLLLIGLGIMLFRRRG
ncbi:PspC domain-containing protein [Herpetosiphon geysericola]|uniref:Phage shock protein PspC N-terminal domain-containing protein n=1 Tax=Herpetosiphon geysericola TaxID=70996 RepID=A0A0N8GPM2_9CHLR|nr:PspC domain-containing protein [Herpetosiphon geysericola]KPL81290.1 hypothetical protein SE18_21705 [Herpetosiphon geysericola]